MPRSVSSPEPLGVIIAHDGGLTTAIPGESSTSAVTGVRFTEVEHTAGIAIAGAPSVGAWVHDGRRWSQRWEGDARSVSVLPGGDLYVGDAEGGLHRSTDLGFTWNTLEGVQNVIRHIVQDRAFALNAGESQVTVRRVVELRDGLLLAFAGGGAWHTRDLGRTWTRRGDGLNPQLHDIWPHPEHRDRLYASTDAGLYRSEDDGFSWLHSEAGLDRAWGGSVAVLPGAPDTLIAAVAEEPGRRGALFRSPNGGASWSRIELGGPSEFERIPCVARPWGWDDVAFVAAGDRLWATHDRGRSFVDLGGGRPVANAIAVSL